MDCLILTPREAAKKVLYKWSDHFSPQNFWTQRAISFCQILQQTTTLPTEKIILQDRLIV